MTAKLISVIGPTAVGKTTLARLLGAALPARVLYEDYAGNPFLPGSYMGEDGARLPAQLCYLFSRAKQLALSSWPAEGLVVSDYGFCQDRIYASARLGPADLALYGQVSARVEPLLRAPEVIVDLDAAEGTLLERISARGRSFERGIGADLLGRMREAYGRLRADPPCALVHVDCDQTDPREPEALARLAAEIRSRL